jgi:hypothetical protein
MKDDHGNFPHKILIHMAKLYLEDAGWQIKDPNIFKDTGAVPDVYAVKYDKQHHSDGSRNNIFEQLIVEVEMSPTKASINKKIQHWLVNRPGLNLLILDARRMRQSKIWEVTLGEIYSWLKRSLG